jgi:hypothetical protein
MTMKADTIPTITTKRKAARKVLSLNLLSLSERKAISAPPRSNKRIKSKVSKFKIKQFHQSINK